MLLSFGRPRLALPTLNVDTSAPHQILAALWQDESNPNPRPERSVA